MPEVRCVECGLLALQMDKADELRGANVEYRETGKASTPGANLTYKPEPHCYVNAKPIHKQVPNPNGYPEILELIRKTHDCSRFLEWMPGRTPKEHLDMDLQRQIIELAQKREDADRQWRKDCDERDIANRKAWEAEQRTWRQEDAKTESRRFLVNLAILGIVVSIVTAASQIVGSMIQASWIEKPAIFDATEPAPFQGVSPNFGQIGAPSVPAPIAPVAKP